VCQRAQERVRNFSFLFLDLNALLNNTPLCLTCLKPLVLSKVVGRLQSLAKDLWSVPGCHSTSNMYTYIVVLIVQLILH